MCRVALAQSDLPEPPARRLRVPVRDSSNRGTPTAAKPAAVDTAAEEAEAASAVAAAAAAVRRPAPASGSVDINLVRAVQLLVGTRPGQSGQVLVAREARISQAVLSNWLRLKYGGDLNKVRTERRGACIETIT
jgi:hypothetical protein